MAKDIVTLYIDDSSIRLLVTEDKQVKKWSELPLAPDMVKGNVVLKEQEVATQIKQLLQTQKIKVKKVAVGLSGLHCLSRPIVLPQLPKAMMSEAVIREARRVLPVPLEQLFVSWRQISTLEGKTQVFLAAVPIKTVESVFNTLNLAGLKPYLMDMKPLILTEVADRRTAIIVDVQPTDFDIVIMVDGVPLYSAADIHINPVWDLSGNETEKGKDYQDG